MSGNTESLPATICLPICKGYSPEYYLEIIGLFFDDFRSHGKRGANLSVDFEYFAVFEAPRLAEIPNFKV
jgi:hypothetical protein